MPGLNLTRDEAANRAELLTVDSYDVTLDLTRGPEVFGSSTVVKFSAVAGSSTFIDAITHTVHSVTLNGTDLDPAEVSDGVRIQLPGLAAENELTIVADAPYMNTGEGLHRFVDPVDGEAYLYTQFEVPDSRRMFAVFEQPDLKASFTFTVTAPSHWDVVSNSPTPVPVEAPAADDGRCTLRMEIRADTPALLLRHCPDCGAVPVGPFRSHQLRRPGHSAGSVRPQIADAVPGRREHL
ncbi:aminopeptidase N [Paenarthrobacter histidinolovorans]|uniref:Aminopeptidase N n=1 Tax=Paenarthrobacter histidinolovorans TaxID=43664 RepID=A0ABW8N5L8_9MICC